MGYTQHGNDLNPLHELYSIGVQQLRKTRIEVLHQMHPSIIFFIRIEGDLFAI